MPFPNAHNFWRLWLRALRVAFRAMSACLCAGLVVSGLAPVAYASPNPSDWGRPVLKIRLDCDAQLNLRDFAAQISQKVGEPLDRAKVAESLKGLYATGRFRELRADAKPADSGVELVFVARARFFVGVVRVEGSPKALDPQVLERASRLQLGQPIEEADLLQARKRLMTTLAENAFYRPQVRSETLSNPATQEGEIVFLIDPSQPARLNGVEFQGNLSAPKERLLAVSGWRKVSHLTSARLERGLFRIHRFYMKRGRPQALATIKNRTYDPQHNTEKLLVEIEAGPLVDVQVKGAKISSSKLRELLPFFQEGTLDENAVRGGERTLEDYFEQRGYFLTTVEGERQFHADSQTVDITYTVSLHKPGIFVGYGFEGNHSVTAERLGASLTIHPKDFFRERGTFSRQMLEDDVKALKTLYASEGFLEARVSPQIDDSYEGKSGYLFVTFEIQEGPRTTVRQLALLGIDADRQKQIWPSLLSKAGQPYSPAHAQRDREFILNYLADRGYLHATVNWKASPISPGRQVDLEFQIHTGSQEKIRNVVLVGNQHTRVGTIRRELTIQSGDPLSQRKMLESQRRLYDLGTFSQVQITPQDTPAAETDKTVVVGVEEARRWTVGYGGGMEVQRLGSNVPQGQLRASPRLSLEVSRLNVGGRAQTFTLRGRLSNLETGGAASYLIPHFPTRRDLSLRLNALVDRSRDVLTFTSKRREASVSLEKHYSPSTLLVGRFSFRRVEALDVRVGEEQLIPLLSRPARVAMLSLSYANDHRDDPADATQGSYSLADAGVSWKNFGSQSNFLRVSAQNATYYRLSRHLVFARNTRLAVESTVGPAGPTEEIPLPERFFMGGSESHRGFSINQAGPRDLTEGYPIGGNALFLNSLELRARLGGNRLGFVLFHDAGNVYSSVQRMRLLKVTQNSPTDFDYTSHAVGLGVRYRTPVGPARFDVGYNLNPPRFQVVDSATGLTEVRRLSHFQFFLSIGQSF
jgi:outer membrane protein insertion porin family